MLGDQLFYSYPASPYRLLINPNLPKERSDEEWQDYT